MHTGRVIRTVTKRILSIIITIFTVAALAFTLIGCGIKELKNVEIKRLQAEGDMTVAVISDFQLPPTKKEDDGVFAENLRKSLAYIKSQNVDMILIIGDVADKNSQYAYDTYNNMLNSVYQAGEKRPEIQAIMGNHDYYGGGKSANRARFTKNLNTPWTHYEMNGYHFIGCSPDGDSMASGYEKVNEWVDGEIQKAIAEDSNKPIFVLTHNSADDTVYGTDEWGDASTREVFSKYPQVVNLAGHLHYSILDERSIHQDTYTTIATQSLSYTEMEKKTNGSIPPNAKNTPMGLIMEFGSENINIKRINFATEREEKGDKCWTLPTVLNKEAFTYINATRKENNAAPTMPSDKTASTSVKGDNTYITLPQGSDDDFVHSYKLVWSDGVVQYYYSNFYNGISAMGEDLELQIFNKVAGSYSVTIYAVDSWGKESTGLEVSNVNVLKKVEYK